MTAPGTGEGDFKMAGAYVSVTLRDDTQAGLDELRAKIEGGVPLQIQTVAAAPDTRELDDFEPEPIEVPVYAENPIDEEFVDEVNAALADLDVESVEVPAEVADPAEFTAAVQELVENAQAEVAQGVHVPVTVDNTSSSSAGSEPVENFRPSYEPTPLFGGETDPYEQARQQLADEPPLEVPVVAENPITAAWEAQVDADLKSVVKDALQIPVDADTLPFRDQVIAQLAELAELRANVPLEVANSDEFRNAVTEQVEAISQSVHAVITMEVDGKSLEDVRNAVLGAAAASEQEVKAQQDLAEAMQKGNAEDIAKAQQALAEAEVQASAAADEQATALAALAQAEAEAGDSADAASIGFRGMDAAMGPLWGVLSVVQMAMFAFSGSSTQAASTTQDLSQQLIALGRNGSNAASTLSGNSGLDGINTSLHTINSSAADFSQAFSGTMQQAKGYVDQLVESQNNLGAAMTSVAVTTREQQGYGGTFVQVTDNQTMSVKQLTDAVNSHTISMDSLSPSLQRSVNEYNAYNDVITQAKKALADEQATQLIVTQDLAQQGIVLSEAQQGWNAIGQAVGNTVSEFNSSTAGIKAMADATVGADAANANAVANFAQLDAAVSSTAEAYDQAEHGIVTAEQGVQSSLQARQQAIYGVQQAIYGVTQAEQSYQNSLQQEVTAQEAVAAAEKQAQQNLIDLQLQANDAAAATLSAGVNLFDAQTAATALGITAANEHTIASEQVTAQNENQVKAAIALIQAQDQVADSQNSGTQAQQSLNTAQQQGITGNAGVVSAQQQVVSSAQQVAAAAAQVASAQHGVDTAQQAANASSIALQNAQYAVGEAQLAAREAAQAHTSAVDADSRSTDYSTQVGNQNWQMLENLFEKNLSATGSIQQATSVTETEGEKMGFTAGQIDGVVSSISRIPPTTPFTIVGTPSLNLTTLISQATAEGIDPYQLGLPSSAVANALPGRATTGFSDGGLFRGEGTSTSDSNTIRVSDNEFIVNAASTAKHQPLLEAINDDTIPGFADGGVVSPQQAMGLNYRLAGWDGVLQGVSDVFQSFGVNTPNLPNTPGSIDFGTYGTPSGSGGSVGVVNVPSSRSANEAIVQQVFQQMFGWGSGPEWNAAVQLIMMESGFNNTAQNPHSTAYGIFQFLDSIWGSYGIQKTSDPQTQAIGGARYIKARYGDPLGALAHERAYHWYEDGGYLPPGGTLAANGTGKPEMVLPPTMSSTLERIDNAVQSGSGGTGDQHNYYITQLPSENGYQLAMRVSGATQWATRAGRR